MLLISLLLSGAFFGIVPLFAAVIHECGHIAAAKLRGVRLGKLDVGIFGARISIAESMYSYTDEIIVCAAGPLANLVSADIAAIALRICGEESDIVSLFVLSSICLAAVNLLPIRTFDGGRILSSFLSKFFEPKTAEAVVCVSSFFCLFTLWCISLYLLLRTSASLSLFIFSVSIFANIFM